MSFLRNIFRPHDEAKSLAAVTESEENLFHAREREQEVRELAMRLHQERMRNHFGETIAEAMRRRAR